MASRATRGSDNPPASSPVSAVEGDVLVGGIGEKAGAKFQCFGLVPRGLRKHFWRIDKNRRLLQVRIFPVGTPGFFHGVLRGVLCHLGFHRGEEIDLQIVGEFGEVDGHISHLIGDFFFGLDGVNLVILFQ